MPRITRITILFDCLVAILFLLTSTACREEKKWRIGVSQCSEDDWRSKLNDEINREIMFHDDAVVEIRSAKDNSQKQIEDIRYFADNGFDIIIVAPNEAAALTPIIKEVYDSGTPVIIFDRNIIGDSYTARIGADDVGIGKAAAHYALQFAGSGGRAIEIYGLPGSTPAEDRHEGFSKEFEANGGHVVASVPANWNMEEAVPVVDSLLSLYPDVDIIFAHNDRMAIGASQVVNNHNLKGIKMLGVDAAPEIGIQAVADSIIDATFFYPTDGYRLIQTALAILRGEPYERETLIPASSAVDKSNADILLLQNETLKDETGKLLSLKTQMDDYWVQHSSQTSLFYACIAIIILLVAFVFLILRVYWQHKRHQAVLEDQYRLIEKERDKQKDLNNQLQEATQSKLMFFTNVSHDLRTPLTLISGPVTQLASADNLTPQQQTLIKIADKNVRILTRLINQILDFRKYENGKLDLSLSEIDLGKAIADWMESFNNLAQKRDLKLNLETPEGNRQIVAAVDPEKFERVFFNLLSNAFKYTPANGRITVSYGIGGESFVLKVADTGRGISERDLGNIFDRFYQVDRVHPNGSGIGLSLTKAFVELHGGSIMVESILNKGSVFTVTLPIHHISETVVEPQKIFSEAEVIAELDTVDSTCSFDEDKPLVLIIDDNKDIQQLVGELLNDHYNIIAASNGLEGIRKATKYVPDLIVCDVMMPVMDGLECCKRLKSEITTSHIPVLMLTACSMDEQRIQGYDSGADGYLSKPFSDAVLRSRCASLIENRRRIKQLWTSKDSTPVVPAEKTKAPEKSADGSDIDNDFYNRFLTLFRAEMGNPDMNVDGIASRMGLERSQFYRKIKALTNYSPVELIRNLRLKQGRQLLVTTEKTISEIAYEIGFSTPAYFTKCFRDAFGETPTEVRKQIGK